jgi:hypothetical protein
MALQEGQWQIRDLVLGPGTGYRLMDETSPFTLTTRADQSEPRAWNHGSWSGAEWANERVVPMRILVEAADAAGWLTAHQRLAAAFAPTGDTAEQVELRVALGGAEYLLLGRPRMVEPETSLIGVGKSFTRAAFVTQDPRIYSGALSQQQTGLPVQSGGLTLPLAIPFAIDGVLTGGRVDLLNAGTTDTGLVLRIDGPVINPTVALQLPDGEVQRIRFDLVLGTGQWLDVDTAARTALLNGLPQANQRGRAVWDIDPYPLPPGTSMLRYLAGSYNDVTMVTATWRSAWW